MLNISNCGHHDRAPSNVDLLNRLSAALDNAHLDCGCRPQLDEVLARFEKRERLQDARACLANARTQREKLEIALLFLNDLDDLTASESDRSAYIDVAMLFESMAETAQEGARLMRALVDLSDEDGSSGGLAERT
ncbi:MAG: hypothetical protein WBA88_26755 [Pseudaminobacter sp.]